MAQLRLPPAFTLSQAARHAKRHHATITAWLRDHPELVLCTKPVRLIDATKFERFLAEGRSEKSKQWDLDRPTAEAPPAPAEAGHVAD
jgi:hypothetical protein